MILRQFTARLRQDIRLQVLLVIALIVQVIICLTAIGEYHPDQHFQIIEFSSYQLHQPSAAGQVWELGAQIRATLQIYLFSAWYKTCSFLRIHDPYTQLTLLRLFFGIILFVFFNTMTWYYLRDQRPRILYIALVVLNFSWLLPYTRTLFSSEMLSSILFFGGLFLYQLEKNADHRWKIPLLTGFLFSLSFYIRFQTGFAILGVGLWMILFERRPQKIIPLLIGLLVGIALNTLLDRGFYHQWVITPYTYFHVNIIEGKAASMGTASFLLYIGVLIVTLIPPISLLLLWSGFKTSFVKKYSDPLFLSVLLFIIGHCLVAHKEERFLFPILNVIPILIGWGLPDLIAWYNDRKKGWRRFLSGLAIFSIVLNGIVLVLLMITPYSQALHFTDLLHREFPKDPVTIYTIPHTPFETDSRLPFTFYQRSVPNLHWERIGVNDSIPLIRDKAPYITTTYNQISDHRHLLDSLGYEKVFCSSEILWHLNEFLQSKHINTINDIWILYKRKP